MDILFVTSDPALASAVKGRVKGQKVCPESRIFTD